MTGPKYPVKEFARWKIGEHRYVEDADGKLWSGSPRGWSRIPGTLKEAQTAIRDGSWRYRTDRQENPMNRRHKRTSSGSTRVKAAARKITAQIKKLKTKRRQLYR